MTNKKFPDKFIFGTALASYQVEGGIYNNDWTHWENKDNSVCAEPCNEACKHYEFYKKDIDLLVELGIKAFRFSIEWSRIEPQEGKYDLNEIVKGESIFCATGITSNELVNGVKLENGKYITETLVTHKNLSLIHI